MQRIAERDDPEQPVEALRTRCVAMRPPIDLPPMNTPVVPLHSRVASITSRNAASSTGALSGTWRRARIYGNQT